MVSSTTAKELNDLRKAAGERMDEYLETHYPLSDETYKEFERLSLIYVQATETWMKACNPRWKP